MSVTFKVLTYPEAAALKAPHPWEDWEEYQDDGYDYTSGIWRCEDGEPVEFMGSDGGEPEDNTLGRDWSWVAPALQKAYAQGYAAGRF